MVAMTAVGLPPRYPRPSLLGPAIPVSDALACLERIEFKIAVLTYKVHGLEPGCLTCRRPIQSMIAACCQHQWAQRWLVNAYV